MGLLRQPVVQVPTRSQAGSDEQDGFSGGVNPAAAVGIVDPTQYAAVTNMRLVRDQEMAKRPGLRLLGTVTAGSTPYVSTVGTATTVLFVPLQSATAAQTGAVTVGNGTTPAMSVASLAALGSSYARGAASAQFRDATSDVLYIPAYDIAFPKGMLKWNGTTLTENIGSVTSLGQLWVYNQRLFGVKNGGLGYGYPQSQTLYWSALNNGDTIGVTASGGGSATIRTFGGQNLVGGFAVGDTNYILHESAVSTFRGLTYDDISITAGTVGVSPNIGRPLAWTVIDDIGYVLTMKGLFLASGGTFVPVDSPESPDPILQFIRSTPTTDDPTNNACSIVDNPRRREVWIIFNVRTISGGALTSQVFIWSKRFRRFTGRATLGVPITWAGVVTDGSGATGVSLTLLYNIATGKMYGVDFQDDAYQVYQDDSVSYPSSVQMRRFYTEKPSYQKAYRFLNVNMGGGSGETLTATGTSTGATVTYSTTTGGTVADTSNMKAQEVNIIQLSGQGSYLDATITDGTGSSTGWSVLRADVDAYILAQRAG